MAEKLNILVAGRHPEIVPTVVRLLKNNPQWNPTGVLSNEECEAHMQKYKVDILLLSSGLSEADEQLIRQQLVNLHPEAVVIQHYGGGSGLLIAEIYQALSNS